MEASVYNFIKDSIDDAFFRKMQKFWSKRECPNYPFSEMTLQEFLNHNQTCIDTLSVDDYDELESIANLIIIIRGYKVFTANSNNMREHLITKIYFNFDKDLILLS